ncbi:MAG: hypothetical protein HYY16_04340 [Planctomycetes bacterium]|nr:hypothetical protein [Planctomycetota bacterium]
MVDFLTHYVSARVPGGFLADARARSTLVLGVFLPDLISKAIEFTPGIPYYATYPAHSILGTLCVSLALAMLFTQDFRLKAFTTLFFGQLLHVAVDLGKESLGAGSAFLLLPFSLESYDLGFYETEDVLWLLPGNLLILFALRYLAKRAQKAGWVWR